MADDLSSLLKILDDESSQLADAALVRIVNSPDPRLDETLSGVQNTGSRRFRRRIRTIRSILLKRRNRERIARALRQGDLPLEDAVIYCHLMWYDSDTFGEMSAQWNDFLKDSGKNGRPPSLEQCLAFMDSCQFIGMGAMTDPLADTICIGAVLDNCTGTDFMLCIIGHLLGKHWDLDSEIISAGGYFALRSAEGVFVPGDRWTKHLCPPKSHVWTTGELTALIRRLLFLNAVASNGFRYACTTGCAGTEEKTLDFLPYPFGVKKES